METKDKKVVILLVLLTIFSALTAWYYLSSKRGMKGKIKELYSVVIKEQVHDGLPVDSVRGSIERFHDIDSAGYSHDVQVIDFIIQDYKRLAQENKELKKK